MQAKFAQLDLLPGAEARSRWAPSRAGNGASGQVICAAEVPVNEAVPAVGRDRIVVRRRRSAGVTWWAADDGLDEDGLFKAGQPQGPPLRHDLLRGLAPLLGRQPRQRHGGERERDQHVHRAMDRPRKRHGASSQRDHGDVLGCAAHPRRLAG